MTGRARRQGAEHALRTGPEWVVFGVSAAILAIVVGVLVALAIRGSDPAAPQAAVDGEVREVDGRFFVPVEVINGGGSGAREVQVEAQLTVAGTTTTGEQVIDFLGGDERRRLTFVFADDPADGELTVDVLSFADP
jgi:uncharacterized protein (TIGR02588 family)